MPTITTSDGTDSSHRDSGWGEPIRTSHGWPLSAADWDTPMLVFVGEGYRVIAHDRRGYGRLTQTSDRHDTDHYVDDLAASTAHLDLGNAVHSTSGGEVVHYLGRLCRAPAERDAEHLRGFPHGVPTTEADTINAR